MTILISIIIYIVFVSWTSWLVNKPKRYVWKTVNDSTPIHYNCRCVSVPVYPLFDIGFIDKIPERPFLK